MAHRDVARGRIITAEENFCKNYPLAQQDFPALQKYVNKVVRRAYWTKNHNNPIEIALEWNSVRSGSRDFCIPDGPYSTGTHRQSWNVLLDNNTQTRLHILHSLTHIMCGHQRRDGQVAHHGADFVTVYLELVRRFLHTQINEDAKRQFKKLLIAQGVKTKVVSEATRAKQRDAYIKRMTPSEEKLRATLASLEEM